jgi:hypothetical protein
VLAYATTIHKSQGSEYRPWSSRCRPSTTRCCNGTWFTPG